MKFIVLILILFMPGHSLYSSEIRVQIEKLEAEIHQYSEKKSLNIVQEYKGLNKLSVRLENYASSFHKKVIEDIKNKKPLHGQQLTLLHKLASCYIALSTQLQNLAETTNLLTIKVLANLDQLQIFNTVYAPFYSNNKFRRLVNAEDSSYNISKKELKKNIKKLISKKNIKGIKKSVNQLFEDIRNNTTLAGHELLKMVQGHSALKTIKGKKYFKKLRKKLKEKSSLDNIKSAFRFLTHQLSAAFGNFAGSIQSREGYLNKDELIHDEISEHLKPLDIITEKARFALTDRFIPGHFGHNAIWLGTKSQLKEIGMWDHPSIIPLQKEIESGQSIIETDRTGTHLKDLRLFMNVDEFAILRFKDENFMQMKKEEVYTIAIDQLGKKYDFNFDVETRDKLVCSELLYQAFGNVNWPVQDYLGRTTISPDDVASLALFNNPPLSLIYYVSGNKEGVEYKDIDQFAKDMGIEKKDGEFFKVKEICINEEVRTSGIDFQPIRRSKVRKETCYKEYTRLDYKGHQYIDDFDHDWP